MAYTKIKFLVMDVDGTLTDGKIYVSEAGEAFKAFNVKDGYGIKEILPACGIIPVIITARDSRIVEKRCEELGICHVYQGIRNKADRLNQLLSDASKKDGALYTYANVAYIGDDISDMECMNYIKVGGGVVGCPADAIKPIKDIADYISATIGGNGAVREFIEWLSEREEK